MCMPILFAFAWLAVCMIVAWLGKLVEGRRLGAVLAPLFVYVGGYGPLPRGHVHLVQKSSGERR